MAGDRHNPILLGFYGRKRSGKDTAASYLANVYKTQRGSFAAPIYRMLDAMLKYHDHGVPFKDGDLGHPTYDKEKAIEPFGKSLRYMLQTLGTEWGRSTIHKDLWLILASSWLDYIKQQHPYIIAFTDVRFDNEATFIKEHGGYVIHIQRDTGLQDTHVSESGVSISLIDYEVTNDGTLFDLRWKILSLLEDIDCGT